MLVNDTPISAELAAVYHAGGAAAVEVDDRALEVQGVRVVHAALAREGDFFGTIRRGWPLPCWIWQSDAGTR